MKYEERVNEFFNEKYNPNKIDVKSLGWGSIYSQEVRFKVFDDYISDIDRILDVGCGFGDFSYYTNKNILYKGIDINETFVNECISRGLNVEKKTVFEIDEDFDFVFASGIFCHKHENWSDFVLTTMKKMFDISIKGCAANFLYNIDDEKMVSTSISEVYNICSKITDKMFIKQNYKSNDFTIFLEK